MPLSMILVVLLLSGAHAFRAVREGQIVAESAAETTDELDEGEQDQEPSAAVETNSSVIAVTWTMRPFMGRDLTRGPSRRMTAATTYCGDRFYVFGGEARPMNARDFHGFTSDLWEFDPSGGRQCCEGEGEWRQLSETPSPASSDHPPARRNSSLVCTEVGSGRRRRKVLTLFGGLVGLEANPTPIGDVWSFDLGTNTWTRVMEDSGRIGPGVRSSHTAVVTDLDQDSMAVFGGDGADSDVWIYSISGQTWSRRSPSSPPPGRTSHTAFAVPGTAAFRMWGGERAALSDGIWEYDVSANRWSNIGSGHREPYGSRGIYWQGRMWSVGWNVRVMSDEGSFEVSGVGPGQIRFPALAVLNDSLWVWVGHRGDFMTRGDIV